MKSEPFNPVQLPKYEDLNGRMSENAAQLAAAQEQTAAEAAVETPAENKAVPAGRRPFGMPEKAAAVTDENGGLPTIAPIKPTSSVNSLKAEKSS